MKKTKKVKTIRQIKSKAQWKLYWQLAQFAKDLNNLPDAAAIRKDRPKPLPHLLLDLVF